MTIRRYLMRFADGRTATVLDMNNGDPAEVIPGLLSIYSNRPGYVVECAAWVE